MNTDISDYVKQQKFPKAFRILAISEAVKNQGISDDPLYFSKSENYNSSSQLQFFERFIMNSNSKMKIRNAWRDVLKNISKIFDLQRNDSEL